MTQSDGSPDRSSAVLATLVLVAAIANLPLSSANVALPDIGIHFDASQDQLNMVAVGYSVGLAATVLWLGALGDRYGRKQLLQVGVLLSIPGCLLAAWAPSVQVLVGARVLGGVAAGMAYPTTLSLITALWSGAPRTKAIALWSASGGAVAALGSLLAGLLLDRWWWGSVFLAPLPLVLVAIPATIGLLPSHVNETDERVDNIGGALSVVLVGSLIVAINFATVPDKHMVALATALLAAVALVAFGIRQRRARNPLYDLQVARRPIFWVAAVAGIIVFGSLMGSLFIGQQFLQNVLGYSTADAGLAIVPAALLMMLCAPRSAKLVEARGARFTLLFGYAFVLAGFVFMLVTWNESAGVWQVGIAYALVGAGVGFAGTPASHSLTGAVPVRRAGMASATADLQRDLGGAILQSILGALLTAGYAHSFSTLITSSPQAGDVSTQVQGQLTRSFSSATNTAKQFPQYSTQIAQAAKDSFVHGQDWAYVAAIVAVAIGVVLVATCFPGRDEERRLLEVYAGDA